jgi:UDP-N-acetylmuramoylalanine--D-glutamate ligase
MKLLVVGAGKSGEWALRLAIEKGYKCDVYDDRDVSLLNREFVDFCHSNDIAVFSVRDWPPLGTYDLAVISPGVPPKNPVYNALMQANVKMISEVELGYLFCNGKVIGITGSNGKTTVTALTNHILNKASLQSTACGNYGVPFSKALTDNNYQGIYVVELSSFQLELIDKFQPYAASILNLSPDHLDRYDACQDYYLAKFNIFKNMENSQNCFVNKDDVELKKFRKLLPKNCNFVGFKSEGFSVSDYGVFYEGEEFITFNDIKLKGLHNLYNIAFSCSLAKSVGVDIKNIAEGVKSFSPISHRLEFVREINGVEFYNDSKATNFDAVVKAIHSFDSIHLIAGGKFKGGDFEAVKQAAHERVKCFYLIGESENLFFDEFSSMFKCKKCGDLKNAVKLAFKNSVEGDVVLLAPGTASFDQYNNYEERGNEFKKIVAELMT